MQVQKSDFRVGENVCVDHPNIPPSSDQQQNGRRSSTLCSIAGLSSAIARSLSLSSMPAVTSSIPIRDCLGMLSERLLSKAEVYNRIKFTTDMFGSYIGLFAEDHDNFRQLEVAFGRRRSCVTII